MYIYNKTRQTDFWRVPKSYICSARNVWYWFSTLTKWAHFKKEALFISVSCKFGQIYAILFLTNLRFRSGRPAHLYSGPINQWPQSVLPLGKQRNKVILILNSMMPVFKLVLTVDNDNQPFYILYRFANWRTCLNCTEGSFCGGSNGRTSDLWTSLPSSKRVPLSIWLSCVLCLQIWNSWSTWSSRRGHKGPLSQGLTLSFVPSLRHSQPVLPSEEAW